MTERKWTTGPWRISGSRYQAVVADGDTGHDDPFSVSAYRGHLVCESATDGNARIIAAAPDLYEALSGVMGYAEDGALTIDAQPFLDAAYAALAKARGETQ